MDGRWCPRPHTRGRRITQKRGTAHWHLLRSSAEQSREQAYPHHVSNIRENVEYSQIMVEYLGAAHKSSIVDKWIFRDSMDHLTQLPDDKRDERPHGTDSRSLPETQQNPPQSTTDPQPSAPTPTERNETRKALTVALARLALVDLHGPPAHAAHSEVRLPGDASRDAILARRGPVHGRKTRLRITTINLPRALQMRADSPRAGHGRSRGRCAASRRADGS